MTSPNPFDPRVPAVPPAQSASETADPVAPAAAPPRGEVCRYTVFDAYADPARDRDQLVIVTGEPDGTGAVPGFVLGWADAVEASFRPEDLRPA